MQVLGHDIAHAGEPACPKGDHKAKCNIDALKMLVNYYSQKQIFA